MATGRTDALFITLILLWIVKVHALKACTHELFSSHAVSEQFIAVMEQFNRPDMNLILFSSRDRLFRQKVGKLEIIQKLYKCHPSQTYRRLTLYTRLLLGQGLFPKQRISPIQPMNLGLQKVSSKIS